MPATTQMSSCGLLAAALMCASASSAPRGAVDSAPSTAFGTPVVTTEHRDFGTRWTPTHLVWTLCDDEGVCSAATSSAAHALPPLRADSGAVRLPHVMLQLDNDLHFDAAADGAAGIGVAVRVAGSGCARVNWVRDRDGIALGPGVAAFFDCVDADKRGAVCTSVTIVGPWSDIRAVVHDLEVTCGAEAAPASGSRAGGGVNISATTADGGRADVAFMLSVLPALPTLTLGLHARNVTRAGSTGSAFVVSAASAGRSAKDAAALPVLLSLRLSTTGRGGTALVPVDGSFTILASATAIGVGALPGVTIVHMCSTAAVLSATLGALNASTGDGGPGLSLSAEALESWVGDVRSLVLTGALVDASTGTPGGSLLSAWAAHPTQSPSSGLWDGDSDAAHAAAAAVEAVAPVAAKATMAIVAHAPPARITLAIARGEAHDINVSAGGSAALPAVDLSLVGHAPTAAGARTAFRLSLRSPPGGRVTLPSTVVVPGIVIESMPADACGSAAITGVAAATAAAGGAAGGAQWTADSRATTLRGDEAAVRHAWRELRFRSCPVVGVATSDGTGALVVTVTTTDARAPVDVGAAPAAAAATAAAMLQLHVAVTHAARPPMITTPAGAWGEWALPAPRAIIDDIGIAHADVPLAGVEVHAVADGLVNVTVALLGGSPAWMLRALPRGGGDAPAVWWWTGPNGSPLSVAPPAPARDLSLQAPADAATTALTLLRLLVVDGPVSSGSRAHAAFPPLVIHATVTTVAYGASASASTQARLRIGRTASMAATARCLTVIASAASCSDASGAAVMTLPSARNQASGEALTHDAAFSSFPSLLLGDVVRIESNGAGEAVGSDIGQDDDAPIAVRAVIVTAAAPPSFVVSCMTATSVFSLTVAAPAHKAIATTSPMNCSNATAVDVQSTLAGAVDAVRSAWSSPVAINVTSLAVPTHDTAPRWLVGVWAVHADDDVVIGVAACAGDDNASVVAGAAVRAVDSGYATAVAAAIITLTADAADGGRPTGSFRLSASVALGGVLDVVLSHTMTAADVHDALTTSPSMRILQSLGAIVVARADGYEAGRRSVAWTVGIGAVASAPLLTSVAVAPIGLCAGCTVSILEGNTAGARLLGLRPPLGLALDARAAAAAGVRVDDGDTVDAAWAGAVDDAGPVAAARTDGALRFRVRGGGRVSAALSGLRVFRVAPADAWSHWSGRAILVISAVPIRRGESDAVEAQRLAAAAGVLVTIVALPAAPLPHNRALSLPAAAVAAFEDDELLLGRTVSVPSLALLALHRQRAITVSLSVSATHGVVYVTAAMPLPPVHGNATAALRVGPTSLLDATDALATIAYQPAANWNGVASMSFQMQTRGGGGGGAQELANETYGVRDERATLRLGVNVAAVNDPPSITWLGAVTPRDAAIALTGTFGEWTAISGLALHDVDVDADDPAVVQLARYMSYSLTLQVEPSASIVRLAAASLTQRQGEAGAGNSTFRGTLVQLNRAVSGLRVRPPHGFVGQLTLRVVLDDEGNVGQGGGQTSEARVAVTVAPPLLPPVIRVGDAGDATTIVFGWEDTDVALPVVAFSPPYVVPEGSAAPVFTVAVDVEHGNVTALHNLSLSRAPVAAHTPRALTLSGTAANLTAALRSLVFRALPNWNAFAMERGDDDGAGVDEQPTPKSADVTIRAWLSRSGSATANADAVATATIRVVVVPVDDAPAVDFGGGGAARGREFAGDGMSATIIGFTQPLVAVQDTPRLIAGLTVRDADASQPGAPAAASHLRALCAAGAADDARYVTISAPGPSAFSVACAGVRTSVSSTFEDVLSARALLSVTIHADHAVLSLPGAHASVVTDDPSDYVPSDARATVHRPLRLVGTAAEVRAALGNGLLYAPDAQYAGPDALSVVVVDFGSGHGGFARPGAPPPHGTNATAAAFHRSSGRVGLADSLSIPVLVAGVRTPPRVLLSAPELVRREMLHVAEDSELVLPYGALSVVAHPDDGGTRQVVLAVFSRHGMTVRLGNGSGVTSAVWAGDAGAAPVLCVRGTAAALTAALHNGATLVPPRYFNTQRGGIEEVTLAAADADDSAPDDGGPRTATLLLYVLAVNNGPVVHVPGETREYGGGGRTRVVSVSVMSIPQGGPSAVSGVAVEDVDADEAPHVDGVTVRVRAWNGTLTVPRVPGVMVVEELVAAFAPVAPRTAPRKGLTLGGPLARVNEALAGLQYVSDAGYYGSDAIDVVATDNGATGQCDADSTTRRSPSTVTPAGTALAPSLGALTDTARLPLRVYVVDAPPVWVVAATAAALIVAQDAALGVPGVVVVDRDAAPTGLYELYVRVAGVGAVSVFPEPGVLALAGPPPPQLLLAAVPVVPLTAVPDASLFADVSAIGVTLYGTLQQLNAALAGLTYTPLAGWSSSGDGAARPSDIVWLTITDLSGPDGRTAASPPYAPAPQTTALRVTRVYTVNAAPHVLIPGATTVAQPCHAADDGAEDSLCGAVLAVPPRSVPEDTDLEINDVVVVDPDAVDAAGAVLTITVTAEGGNLRIDGGGSGIAQWLDGGGPGVPAASVQFECAPVLCTTALARLVFRGAPEYFGTASISINVDDNGFAGVGGPRASEARISIDVTPVNDPVLFTFRRSGGNDAPGAAPPSYACDEDAAVALSGVGVADVDAVPLGDRSGVYTVTALALHGHLLLPRLPGVDVVDLALSLDPADPATWASSDAATELRAAIAGAGAAVRRAAGRVRAPSFGALWTALASAGAAAAAAARANASTAADDADAGAPTEWWPSQSPAWALPRGMPTSTSSLPTPAQPALRWLSLTGTLADVDAALAELQYAPSPNWNSAAGGGPDTVLLRVTDGGSYGAGGPTEDTAALLVNVAAVNDGPVVTFATGVTADDSAAPPESRLARDGVHAVELWVPDVAVFEDSDMHLPAAVVVDVDADDDADAGGGVMDVEVTAGAGTVTIALGGADGAGGVLDATASAPPCDIGVPCAPAGGAVLLMPSTSFALQTVLRWTATLATSNMLLAHVRYRGLPDVYGHDVVTVRVSDRGHSGTGRPLTDTAFLGVRVLPVNDAPTITVPRTRAGAPRVFHIDEGGAVAIVGAEEGVDLDALAAADVGGGSDMSGSSGAAAEATAPAAPGGGVELWATRGALQPLVRFGSDAPAPPVADDATPAAVVTAGYELGLVAGDGSGGGSGRVDELWRLALVRDIATGAPSSSPASFAPLLTPAAGGAPLLVFTAWTPATGRELWATDGTPGGTRLVADLAPGAPGADPAGMTAVAGGSRVFFAANGRDTTWVDTSDDCAGFRRASATLAADGGGSGSGDADVHFAVAHPGAMWEPSRPYDCPPGYAAATTAEAEAIFTDDGAAAPASSAAARARFTPALADHCRWTGMSFGGVPRARKLRFADSAATGGWKDGAGAESAPPGRGDFDTADFAGVVCVRAPRSESAAGRELWTTDGTAAGTRLAVDVKPGPAGSNPRWIVAWTPVADDGGTLPSAPAPAAATTVVFVADVPGAGAELLVSDGTAAATAVVFDVWPGPRGSDPRFVTAVPAAAIAPAYSSAEDAAISSPPPPAPARFLLFAADDGVHGRELWRTGGAPERPWGSASHAPSTPASSTRLVSDVAPGASGSDPRWLVALPADAAAVDPGGIAARGPAWLACFSARGPAIGREAWVTDGTAAGTALLADVCPGSCSGDPRDFTYFRGAVYFSADDGAGRGLFVADGTPGGGAARVGSAHFGPRSPSMLTVFTPDAARAAAALYFVAVVAGDAGSAARRLFICNGTTAGTRAAFASDVTYPNFNLGEAAARDDVDDDDFASRLTAAPARLAPLRHALLFAAARGGATSAGDAQRHFVTGHALPPARSALVHDAEAGAPGANYVLELSTSRGLGDVEVPGLRDMLQNGTLTRAPASGAPQQTPSPRDRRQRGRYVRDAHETAGDDTHTRSDVLRVNGSLAAVNSALRTLVYRGRAHANGDDAVHITIVDVGAYGDAAALAVRRTTAAIPVAIAAVNDAPTVTIAVDDAAAAGAAGGPARVPYGGAADTSGLGVDLFVVVADPDGGERGAAAAAASGPAAAATGDDTDWLTVRCTASSGTLTVATSRGITFVAGAGVSSTAFTVTGAARALNRALQPLRYACSAASGCEPGVHAVRVDVDDGGRTGAGGAQHAAAEFTVEVAIAA